ncbi:LysM peptidoglycan-binding domain-containing protein [Roseomonas sp. KE2513]|uniref:LysM peptidoglycan-binding domain-containing protein n=1 Tax=Roseomonas sp. KE2513 TaxID=2479202 RepID=UPI0018DF2911|nr:LysM peptidoglycan-binding domain-containing protein [Roseomonas sp. KE2513]
MSAGAPPAPATRPLPADAMAEPVPRPAAELPRFDVVRLGTRGMAVTAGRSSPGAEVVLLDGGEEIGRARADGRGEWVILPPEPLAGGPRELSLRSRLPGGEELRGPDTVLVVGPARLEPPLASLPATAPSDPGSAAPPSLVLLLPPIGAAAPRRLSPSAGPVALGLDVLDYDEAGGMVLAGTAPPGARLRVYADDRHLGDTAANETGRWSLGLEEPPVAGQHILRVEELARTGRAAPAGRIQVAFEREFLPPGVLREGRLVVQPGHNLWRIARDSYGRGARYTVILSANREGIRHPDRIFPGQVLTLPLTD